jgi:hypothetical protein
MDAPHLCLIDHHWHEERRAVTMRYFILVAASGDITRHPRVADGKRGRRRERAARDYCQEAASRWNRSKRDHASRTPRFSSALTQEAGRQRFTLKLVCQ